VNPSAVPVKLHSAQSNSLGGTKAMSALEVRGFGFSLIRLTLLGPEDFRPDTHPGPSLVLRSAGLAAGIGLFVNQGNSFRLSSGVFTIPPTHGYRRPVVELWNTLAHA
jgi:hypothetical protein